MRCSVIDSSRLVVGSGKPMAMRWRQPPAMEKPGNSQMIEPTLADGSQVSSGSSRCSSIARNANATRSCGPKPSKIAVFDRLVLKTVFL